MVLELEHVIRRRVVEEIHSRTNIGTGDEFERECVAGRGNAVCSRIISTIECTILRACGRVGAKGGIPSVTGVAVGVATDVVQPTPVGIENDGRRQGATSTTSRALLDGKCRMYFCRRCTDLLSAYNSEEDEWQERGCEAHVEKVF